MPNYESEMRGMHKKADFNNAQPDMMGEKPKKKAMAAGGVAKMRKGVADSKGAPRHMATKVKR